MLFTPPDAARLKTWQTSKNWLALSNIRRCVDLLLQVLNALTRFAILLTTLNSFYLKTAALVLRVNL